MDLQLLDKTLEDHGEPPFRARQVWSWVAHGAGSYEEMTDLPTGLRHALTRELPFSSLTLRRELRARDGTVKTLFSTADGHPLEAVMMRYGPPRGGGRRPRRGRAAQRRSGAPARPGWRSICLSSQSGCPLTCSFCATGAMRFARNLTASEIIEQALHFRRLEPDADAALTHCVFMGMGEPLLNLEAVLAACERLPDLGISHRRTAISTVGWIPGIERLAEQELPLRLALSVHAADEALRSELMPVNERYPLAQVLEACRALYARKRRRVLVEYVMLDGVNDRYAQALALARALSEPRGEGRRAFKVNLIPYNPTPPREALGAGRATPYRCSTPAAIAAFREALRSRGIPATVRLTRGRDIKAACGQLAGGERAGGAASRA
jgi:23S rRNA (adenine2503-C2)-methyltransferase